MKKYLITAGLLFGLAGMGVSAQTTPNSTDPNPSGGVQSTPPTFPTDQQSTASPGQSPSQDPTATTPDQTDRTKRSEADADQTTSSPTSSQSGSSSAGQDSASQGSSTGSQSQPGMSGSQTPADQTGSSTGSASGSSQDVNASSAAGSTGAQSQIQSALQQKGLSNVNATVSTDSIELTGTVETGKEKKEAKKIAEAHANGLKVKDNIKVTGKGEAKQDNQ
jgi:hypothetical protein